MICERAYVQYQSTCNQPPSLLRSPGGHLSSQPLIRPQALDLKYWMHIRDYVLVYVCFAVKGRIQRNMI